MNLDTFFCMTDSKIQRDHFTHLADPFDFGQCFHSLAYRYSWPCHTRYSWCTQGSFIYFFPCSWASRVDQGMRDQRQEQGRRAWSDSGSAALIVFLVVNDEPKQIDKSIVCGGREPVYDRGRLRGGENNKDCITTPWSSSLEAYKIKKI